MLTLKRNSVKILCMVALLVAVATSCKKDDDVEKGNVDLSVTISADKAKTDIGTTVTYTITAKNIGEQAATAVVVDDRIPAGLVFESGATQTGSYNAEKGIWTIGTLQKSATATLTLKVKVAGYSNQLKNRVSISSSDQDSENGNNSAIATIATNLPDFSKEQGWSFDVFDTMQSIYLWEDALPAAIDPAKYASPENLLEYLKGLKINPETNQPIDRYSFLDKIGNLSGEIGEGKAKGDYGFMITAGMNAAKQVSFYVTYVYKQSPAGVAGVERGLELVGINGSSEVHPEVTADGYLDSKSIGYINVVNALFSSEKAAFSFKKTDGTTLNADLSVGDYNINSVLHSSTYDISGKKIGYVVFNQFLGTPAQTELQNVISDFESKGVQYLIVDLRYNGGGAVATCQYFSNLILPKSATGKDMFTYRYNPEFTKYWVSKNYALTVKVSKTNNFEPLKIYFIVGSGTASASELLINNMKPYYPGNVFLIGGTTHGKPCGFRGIPIGYDPNQATTKEGYDLYAVDFETVNANKEGGYYTGMVPGSSKYPGIKEYDSYLIPWGDTRDLRLAQAISHITTGSFKPTTAKSSYKELKGGDVDRQFKGMIDFKRK